VTSYSRAAGAERGPDEPAEPGLRHAAKLQTLLGRPASGLAAIATGYFESPRFQTLDPNGNGPFSDLPIPRASSTARTGRRLRDDRRALHPRRRRGPGRDRDAPDPVHGHDPERHAAARRLARGHPAARLGGQRDTVVAFAEADAAAGFASIGIDAVQHGYRFFDCGPGADCSQDTHNNFGGTAVPTASPTARSPASR